MDNVLLHTVQLDDQPMVRWGLAWRMGLLGKGMPPQPGCKRFDAGPVITRNALVAHRTATCTPPRACSLPASSTATWRCTASASRRRRSCDTGSRWAAAVSDCRQPPAAAPAAAPFKPAPPAALTPALPCAAAGARHQLPRSALLCHRRPCVHGIHRPDHPGCRLRQRQGAGAQEGRSRCRHQPAGLHRTHGAGLWCVPRACAQLVPAS